MSLRHRAGTVLVTLVVGLSLGSPASAAPGVFVLDGRGGTSGRTTHAFGRDTANAVFDGDLFVFSYDATAGNLRVGRRTDRWRFATLDGAGGSTVG